MKAEESFIVRLSVSDSWVSGRREELPGNAPLWVCGGEAYLIQPNLYTGGRCAVPSSGLMSQKEKDTRL